MNKRNILFGSLALFFLSVGMPARAQMQPLFSLLQYSVYQQDTSKIGGLIQKAVKERESSNSTEQGLAYATEAYELSKNINYLSGMVRSSSLAGNFLRIRGKYGEAMDYYLKLVAAAEQMGTLTVLFDAYMQNALFYHDWGVYEKSVDNTQKALGVANNLDATYQMKALQYLAIIYRGMGQVGKAENTYIQLISIAKQYKQRQLMESATESLIGIYMSNMQIDKALSLSTDMLESKKADQDYNGMIAYMNKIGILHRHLEQYSASLKYFEKAVKVGRSQNKSEPEIAPMLMSIGVVNQLAGDNDKALVTFEEVLKIRRAEGKTDEIANVLNYLITLHIGKGDYTSARNLSDEAIALAKQTNNLQLLEKNYLRLSEIHEKSGNSKKALEAYKNYVDVRQKINVEEKKRQDEMAKKQVDAEKREKELKLQIVDQELQNIALQKLQVESEKREQELAFLKQQQDLNEANLKAEQLEKERVEQALRLTQEQLNAQRRLQQIAALQREKEVQDLKIRENTLKEQERAREMELLEKSNALLEADRKLQEKQLAEEASTRKFYYAIIGAFGLIIVFVIVGWVQKNKANKKLEAQQEEILQKNEELAASEEELRQNMEELAATNELVEAQKNALADQNLRLTDSIKYAERIQTAILPPPTQLSQVFAKHFIIYQPKDIVSGDFYWFSQVDNMVFVAAVDCTGHGVPGAFMSMIGNTLLNQIVNERRILETSEILNTLHVKVLDALKQRDSKNVDGMDVSLCRVINLGNGKFEVSYSGAKCSMFFSSDQEIHQAKPDRKSIGGWDRTPHQYTSQSFVMQSGDRIYLSTDGIIDAANTDRKRLGTKHLMAILEKHQHRPLYEQKLQIERELDEYQSGSDQRDDITFVGFELP